jgi:peptidoglycan L-alanyl-D-glutamate endopeptidase CwlK
MGCDPLSMKRILLLHPLLREETIDIIYEINSKRLTGRSQARITQSLRTFAEQDDTYAQGRTKPGSIVTSARGGQSYHNYGLAVDFALLVDMDGNGTFETASWDMQKDWDKDTIKDWNEVVEAFEKRGWEWGGRWKSFKDYPHFQKVFGHSWQECLRKYNAKDMDYTDKRYIRIS